MRATIRLGNIVGIREEGFLIGIIPLQRDLNANTIFPLDFKMKYLTENRFVMIQIINKGSNAAFILERFCAS